MGARAGAIWLAEAGRLALAHELRYADMGIRDNANSVRLNERLLSDAITTGQAASFSPDDPSMAGKMPVDFLIIVAALQIGEDCVGAVEIFQRPDAPREARPGFLQFVEQMTGHASRLSRTAADRNDQTRRLRRLSGRLRAIHPAAAARVRTSRRSPRRPPTTDGSSWAAIG